MCEPPRAEPSRNAAVPRAGSGSDKRSGRYLGRVAITEINQRVARGRMPAARMSCVLRIVPAKLPKVFAAQLRPPCRTAFSPFLATLSRHGIGMEGVYPDSPLGTPRPAPLPPVAHILQQANDQPAPPAPSPPRFPCRVEGAAAAASVHDQGFEGTLAAYNV